ncbi:uncharacterized protein LOC127831327 [Dreissena polymorpha]|uniref:uncharacterized protein LOC127831327 n=1 Tax=Dreissena polymorpha TaxID=45954 RepID=UPI002264CC28|nr:uncharacterized protein LOC127831327 [Dreissena polymorpha]
MKRTQVTDSKKLWKPGVHDRICSLHLVGGRPIPLPDHPDYVPSQFYFTPARKTTPHPLHRFERMQRRCCSRRSLTEELVNESTQATARDDHEAVNALLELGSDLPSFSEKEPDPLLQSFEELQQDYNILQKEYQHLLDENSRLKQENKGQHVHIHKLEE